MTIRPINLKYTKLTHTEKNLLLTDNEIDRPLNSISFLTHITSLSVAFNVSTAQSTVSKQKFYFKFI